MNKGCIIGLVIFGIIAILGIGAAIFFGKKALGFGQSTALYVVEEAIKDYSADNSNEIPAEATNEAWTAVLKGTDYDKIERDGNSLELEIDQFIQGGKMMDVLRKNPITLQKGADGAIVALLPGKDGEIGTADDISSASFRNLINKGKAE